MRNGAQFRAKVYPASTAPRRKAMNKLGLIVLGGSIAAAAFLLIIWLIGFLVHIGGALIHLLLVLAMVLGFLGGIVGIVLLIVGKKS